MSPSYSAELGAAASMRYYIMKIGIYKEANSKSRNTKGEDVGRAGCQSKNKGKIRNAYN